MTFPILHKHLEPTVLTVTDEEMIRAMRLVFEDLKLVIEMSAGAGVAAALKVKKVFPELKRVGVILCGGNVGVEQMMALIEQKS